MEEYWVYILYSPQFKKSYIGQTNNLDARIERHNAGQVTSTKRYKPWVIIHTEKFSTRSEAMKKETFLKSGMGREFIKTIIKEHQKNG